MAESGVILPSDTQGQKAQRTNTQTTTFTSGFGGVVHQPVIAVGDPTTPANLQAVDATGAAKVSQKIDTGRTQVVHYSEAYSVTNAEVLVPATGTTRGGTAVTPGTTQLTVTTGKTLRIEHIICSVVALGATVTSTRIRLRANFAGAALVTSPIVASWRVGFPPGTPAANHAVTIPLPLPDGFEFPSTAGLQFTAVASTTLMHAIDLTVIGFEY